MQVILESITDMLDIHYIKKIPTPKFQLMYFLIEKGNGCVYDTRKQQVLEWGEYVCNKHDFMEDTGYRNIYHFKIFHKVITIAKLIFIITAWLTITIIL